MSDLLVMLVVWIGLILGNLIRQLLPFFRLVLEKEELSWEATYTKRMVYAVVFSLLASTLALNSPTFQVVLGDLLLAFLGGVSTGVNANWLAEEVLKWEWQSGASSVVKG